MRKFIGLLIVGALISLGQGANAGPFEDGFAAHQRGDYATTLKLVRPLAEKGEAKSQYLIGKMYAEGRGVVLDDKEAVRWYRLAAEQGAYWALNDLGYMYDKGKGVSQDNVRAYMWYSLAAAASPLDDKGSKTANYNRDTFAQRMTPAQIAQAQDMVRKCQQSNYRQCGEPEKVQTAIAASPTLRNAPATTATPPSAQTAPAKTVAPLQAARTSASTNIAPSPRSPTTSVPMKQQPSGTFAVPVLINGAITLNFMVDSGASDVSIPADVALTLMRTGTLTQKDFTGKKTYRLADGSTMPSETFVIRSLKVGDRVVENVMGSVAPVTGSLLLGQSFLGKFRSWSIDNTKHALVLE